jgi:hypothetical protein
MGYLTVLALRAAIAEPPEDFITRIEPGLDEETRGRLARGLRILQTLRRLERWIYSILGAALIILVGGGSLSTVPFFGAMSGWIFPATFASLGLAALLFLALLGISLAYRKDLRRIYAFWRAMQGSSLARDIA